MVAFYAAVFLGAVILKQVMPAHVGALWAQPFSIDIIYLLVSALVVNLACLRFRWRDLAWLGWPGWGRAVPGFARGLGIGCGMAAAVLLLGMITGSASVTLSMRQLPAYIPAALWVGLGLAIAALAEELMFRGLPLADLAQWLGRGPASAVMAVLFAVAHLGNPGVSAVGYANIALAGLVLSAAFFSSGGLAAAWGLHLGWNAGFSLGADAPVSGLSFQLPGVDYSAGRPSWWIGGAFGPEEGLAATVVMAAATLWLARRNLRVKEESPR